MRRLRAALVELGASQAADVDSVHLAAWPATRRPSATRQEGVWTLAGGASAVCCAGCPG